MLKFCDFIQVYVFTTNHHLNSFLNIHFSSTCNFFMYLFLCIYLTRGKSTRARKPLRNNSYIHVVAVLRGKLALQSYFRGRG